MSKSIAEKIRERIGDLVAEEELEAMVDAELTGARERARRVVENALEKTFVKAIEDAMDRKLGVKKREKRYSSDEDVYTIEDPGDRFDEDAEKVAISVLESAREAATRSAGERVESALVAVLDARVAEWATKWRQTEECNELAERCLKDLLPRAAAAYAERAALAVINRMQEFAIDLPGSVPPGFVAQKCAGYNCEKQVVVAAGQSTQCPFCSHFN